jgi:diketogulonate reductase-like aldo/keto reductase
MAQVNQLVLRYKQQAQALPAHYSAHAHRLHVLIKATDHSLYADLIQTIDALLINDVQDYALVDPDAMEQQAVAGK